MPVSPNDQGDYEMGEIATAILEQLRPGQKESNIWVRRRIAVEGVEGVEDLDQDPKGREAYWAARAALIEAGEVQRVWGGHGGSVRRLIEPDEGDIEPAGAGPEDGEGDDAIQDETHQEGELPLYGGIKEVLERDWSRERLGSRCVVAITAQQGRRVLNSYSNAWTRPDLTAVIETKWERLRQPEGFEVVTFEVKTDFDRLGIYEALSHSRRAHQSYVLVVPKDEERDQAGGSPQAEFCQEAGEVGIGVIVASKHDSFDAWEEVLPPQHREPNLHLLDEFLQLFFDDEKWEELGNDNSDI